MTMRYFRDFQDQVHGFDDGQAGDVSLMNQLTVGWTEITGNWPPPPTEEQLLVQKNAELQASIDSLGSTGSDASMSRGLEDLISLLMGKGTIAKTDLPSVLLAKINNRRAARGQAAL